MIAKRSHAFLFAERGGFEPPLRFRKHAFQACAFSHSATSPLCSCRFQLNSTRAGKTTHFFAIELINLSLIINLIVHRKLPWQKVLSVVCDRWHICPIRTSIS